MTCCFFGAEYERKGGIKKFIMHNRLEIITHFRDHQSYPAQKNDLTRACDNMADLEPEDRQWLTETLKEKYYTSASEVVENLGW